jgi:hypothetical protein
LPQEAIQPGNAVWTVDNGRLRRKEVSIVSSDSEFVVAFQEEGGLQAGNPVVVSPLATPIEGLEVTTFDSKDLVDKQARSGKGGEKGGGRKPSSEPPKNKEVAAQ